MVAKSSTPYDDGSHRNDPGAPSGPPVPPHDYDAYDLMRAGPPKPLQWLVPGVLPRPYFLLMGADAKAGKSRLTTTCALKVATSQPEVGIPPKVLYISPDSTDRDEWAETINELLEGEELEPGRFIVWFEDIAEIESKPNQGLLRQIEDKLKADPAITLVVVDVLNSVKAGKREGDDIQRSDHRSMRPFAKLAERYAIAVAVLTHTNVHGQIAGSMGLRGGVHGLMKLEREEFGTTVFVHLRGRRIKGDIRFKFDLSELSVHWEPPTEEERAEGAEDLAREYELAIQEREEEERRKLPHVPGAIEQKLRDTMATLGTSGPMQLALASGLRHATVKSYLRRMLQRGDVALRMRGLYEFLPATTATTATLGNDAAPQAGKQSGRQPKVAKVAVVAPGHVWDRSCMGACLQRVKPASRESCPRCNLICWELSELGGAPLYICRHCHPRIETETEGRGEGEGDAATTGDDTRDRGHGATTGATATAGKGEETPGKETDREPEAADGGAADVEGHRDALDAVSGAG